MGLLRDFVDELTEEAKWALWDWGQEHLAEPHIKIYNKIRNIFKDDE